MIKTPLNNLLLAILLTLSIGKAKPHAATLTWDADPDVSGAQDGGGSWDTLTNTWWNGGGNVIWDSSTPDSAIFGAASGSAGVITLGEPMAVANISFVATGSTNYVISGSSAFSLTLSGNPAITTDVNAFLHSVLTGTSFTKEGSGLLSLRPPADNTYSGATVVNAGTLALNSSTSSRILIPGDLIINAGATVTNTGAAGPIADTAVVTVNNGATYGMGGGSDVIGSLILDGGTINQSGTGALVCDTVDARAGSMLQAGSGTGKLDCNTLTKSTAGTVLLTTRGSAATQGVTNTIVNAGTLILDYTQTSSKLADSGTLALNGGTLIFMNSASETVGSVILDGGVITNAAATGDLRVPSGATFDVRSGSAYIVLAGGSGRSLTKTTTGTVILAAANAYSSGTTISEGILQLGDGTTSGSVSGSAGITNNATLVLNPGGAGVSVSQVISGTGALIKTGSGTAALTPVNTYQGNTTISNGVLTIDGDATLGDGFGTLVLAGGNLSSTAGRNVNTAPVANPINLVANSVIGTISTATTVDLNLSSDSITGSAGTLTFRNDGANDSGDVFVPRFSGSGFNFSRPIVVDNGPVGSTRLDSYNPASTTQTFSGAISGNGGYRRNFSTTSGGGVTVFNGNNTYTGATEVNRGTLLVNGSLGSSSVVSVGVAPNSEGALGGNGVINGPVTVGSGGTLSPGTSIGKLTINNSLSLSGALAIETSKSGSVLTNDSVVGLTSVSFGGDLVVSHQGDALAAGNSFQLFNIGGTGNFDSITPPPGGGLEWSFNPANGVLLVVSGGAQPILSFSQSANTLTFSWTATGFKLQAQTNNLATGLGNNWGDYPGGDTSPVPVVIDPTQGAVFFQLISQ